MPSSSWRLWTLPIWSRIYPRPAKTLCNGSVSLPDGGDAEPVSFWKRGFGMRILVVEPEHRPEVREIDGSLKTMQSIVDGLIQAIPLIDDLDTVLVCNDEGKLLNLPANRGLRDENGQIYDIVCGTFFICGAPGADRTVSETVLHSRDVLGREWPYRMPAIGGLIERSVSHNSYK